MGLPECWVCAVTGCDSSLGRRVDEVVLENVSKKFAGRGSVSPRRGVEDMLRKGWADCVLRVAYASGIRKSVFVYYMKDGRVAWMNLDGRKRAI